MKETIFDANKKNVGEVELTDSIFGLKPSMPLIYEVIKMQRANQREGSAATRNHKMVSGTTAKMYRQKGTGRARHGDARTNIFVGGGKAFGPHPKDYGYSIPKKARKSAIRSTLSLKKQEGKLIVVDDLSMKKIKTKDAVKILSKLGVSNGLIVVDSENGMLSKSVRNIPHVKMLKWEGLNVYDMMHYDHVVLTMPALTKVQEVFRP